MHRSTPQPSTAAAVPHPAGTRGTLRTADGHQLPVRGYDRQVGDLDLQASPRDLGQDVVLVVLTELDDPLPAEALDPSTLEYTTVRGVIRLQGEACFEDRSLVRFHPEREPEIIQRRAYVRVRTPQEVTLGPLLAGHAHQAHTIDISGGGMLLTGVTTLAVGDPIAFVMALGDGAAAVEGLARVVRIEQDGKRAVAFEQIDEQNRQRLIRFVFECLRTARAKTRGDFV